MKKFSMAVIGGALIILIAWLTENPLRDEGTYETLEEAMEHGIPYEVKDVLHIDQFDGVTIVLYTTIDKGQPQEEKQVEAVAFFKGDDRVGWENIGFHGWSHYKNEHLTVYIEPLRDYDEAGNELSEFYVVFGKVINPEIMTVQTKGKEEKQFEDAKLIEHESGRYYFQISREIIVRGLSKNGDVINQQGG